MHAVNGIHIIIWEFGKLEKNVFTKNLLSYSVAEAQKVIGILDFIFTECDKQLADYAN